MSVITGFFYFIWPLLLGGSGLIAVYYEIIFLRKDLSPDERLGDSIMDFDQIGYESHYSYIMNNGRSLPTRIPWMILDFYLIIHALAFLSNYEVPFFSVIALIIVLLRVLFLKKVSLGKNKDKYLVGLDQFALIGEICSAMQDIAPQKTGNARMLNPKYESHVLLCYAEEPIKNGARVKITEIHCGMPKIVPIPLSATIP